MSYCAAQCVVACATLHTPSQPDLLARKVLAVEAYGGEGNGELQDDLNAALEHFPKEIFNPEYLTPSENEMDATDDHIRAAAVST